MVINSNTRNQPEFNNTFTSGMNTDVSDMLMSSSQYRLARNLRYVTSTNSSTGILSLIPGSKSSYTIKSTYNVNSYGYDLVTTTTMHREGILYSYNVDTGVIDYNSILATYTTTDLVSTSTVKVTGINETETSTTVTNTTTSYNDYTNDQGYAGIYITGKNGWLKENQISVIVTTKMVNQIDTFTFTPTKISASTAIRDYGIVILEDADKKWCVARFSNSIDNSFKQIDNFKIIFGIDQTVLGEKPSIVCRYESDDNIKIYIADGKQYVRVINIAPDADTYNAGLGGIDGSITFYPTAELHKPTITQVTTGTLPAGCVQYSYRLVKKNKIGSDLSPTSNLIQLSLGTGSYVNIKGQSEGKLTDKGLAIQIDGIDTNVFDRVLLYRILYYENGQIPTIELINDTKVSDSTFSYTDTGASALSSLTVEEFNSISGLHIIPRLIEEKNDYLFAANIKSDKNANSTTINLTNYDCTAKAYNSNKTTYTGDVNPFVESINTPQFEISNPNQWLYTYTKDGIYYGGTGEHVSYVFVTGNAYPEKNVQSNVSTFSKIPRDISTPNTSITINHNVYIQQNYADPIFSTNFKSLRRGELYRYGIIFYDKYGATTPTEWIADIRIPAQYTTGFELTSYTSANGLSTKPLLLQFTVDALPENAVGYEIVRCIRKESDRCTITQGVLNKNVRSVNPTSVTTAPAPLEPTDLITTIPTILKSYTGSSDNNYTSCNTMWQYYTTLQYIYQYELISPEIDYLYSTIQNELVGKDLYIDVQGYMFARPDDSSYSTIDSQNSIYSIPLGNKFNIFYNGDLTGGGILLENTNLDKLRNGIKKYTDDTLNVVNYYGFSNQVDYWKNAQSSSDLKSISTNCHIKINDIASVKEGSWSDFKNRKNLISNISGHSFCNWIFNGTYYAAATDSNIAKSVYGPNGRCMEVSLNKNPENTNLYDVFNENYVFQGFRSHAATSADIYYPSYAGTFLCNIKQNIIPYGGFDESARQYCTYYSFGDYHDTAGTYISCTGDTYVDILHHVKNHKWYDADHIGTNGDDYYRQCVDYKIPCETDINLAITQGVKLNGNVSGQYSNVQLQASDVYGLYVQTDPLYVYNTAYSCTPTAKIFAAVDEQYKEEQLTGNYSKDQYDTRCYYSNVKTNNETIDSWSKFQSSNFLDVDTKYGQITELKKFHNTLLYWQQNAVGTFSVNERTTISSDNNLPLILGTGDVLSRFDYLATYNGMAENQLCTAQSDNTIYWFDYNKHEICAIGEGLSTMVISKVKNCQNIINYIYSNGLLTESPCLLFDKQYNELLVGISDNSNYATLVYSEVAQAFTSIYTFKAETYIPFYNGIYITDGVNDIEQLNVQQSYSYVFSLPLLPYIKYVISDQPMETKVYDNMEVQGNITNYTDLRFTFTTPLLQTGNSSGSSMTNRERNLRMAIPRQTDSTQYGGRLRGKTMQCELRSTSSDSTFELHLITTKYRTSWS